MLSTLFSFNYGRNHIMKKRFSSIISLLVAATMLLTALVSCGDNNEKKTPSASEYIEKIFDKTFGSVSHEAKNTKTHVVWNSGPDVADSTFMIADINLYSGVSGESVAMIDGLIKLDLYSFGNSVIAVSPVLGETPISATLDDIETLTNLYMPEVNETPESAVGVLDLIKTFVESNTESISKLLKKYGQMISDSAEKATEKKVTANNEKIEIEITFCCDSAKKVIKDIYDKAKKDTELKKLVEGIIKASGASESDLSDMMEEYNDFFASDEKLNELFDQMNKTDFDFTVALSSDALFNLKTLEVKLDADNDLLDIAVNVSDPNYVTVSVNVKEGENTLSTTLTLKTEKLDGLTKISNAVKIQTPEGAQETEIYSLTLTDEGEYVFETVLLGAPSSITGSVSENNGVKTVTVSGITVNGTTEQVYITATTEYGVKIPETPASFKRLTSLTTSEINVIINNVKEHPVIGQLIGALKGQAMPDEPELDYCDEF